MKKKLDTNVVMNELRGQSVFFPTMNEPAPPQEEIPAANTPAHPPPPKKSEEIHNTLISRHHDTVIPRHHDTTVSLSEDDMIEAVRKATKQLGKEPATQRLTLEEKQALGDIEYSYKRQGIKTSGNEIIRIATNYIVRDYQQNGENSILAIVLNRLNS